MLAVNNVSMHFGGLVALNEVSMTVKDGEIRGLIGPNDDQCHHRILFTYEGNGRDGRPGDFWKDA